MPINTNPSSIPVAPPLPAQTGAGASEGKIAGRVLNTGTPSSKPAESFSLEQTRAVASITAALNDRAAATQPGSSSSGNRFDFSSTSSAGLRFSSSTLTNEFALNRALEVPHDGGALDVLNKAIKSSTFIVKPGEDGQYLAVGTVKNQDGSIKEIEVTLSSQEYESLKALDTDDKNRFVFTGGRGGGGHALVIPASDIASAREAIVSRMDKKNTMDTGIDAMPMPMPMPGVENRSSLMSKPHTWIALGSIAAGLIGIATTAIVQAVGVTPAPGDAEHTDPDSAGQQAETAARDSLTKEAFKDANNQKVEIDENGNAKPTGDLKDDVKEAIEQQAKEAGETAKQQAIENNAQAQKLHDEQQKKHDEQMLVSSGVGYGVSSALVAAGSVGLGVTAAMHRKNQSEQTPPPPPPPDYDVARASHSGTDDRGSTGSLSRENSTYGGSTSNPAFEPEDTSSRVVNPYGSYLNESIYDVVTGDGPVYAQINRTRPPEPQAQNIQYAELDLPNVQPSGSTEPRLIGTPKQGIQSLYAQLASNYGLRSQLGGMGSAPSASSNPDTRSTGPARFV